MAVLNLAETPTALGFAWVSLHTSYIVNNTISGTLVSLAFPAKASFSVSFQALSFAWLTPTPQDITLSNTIDNHAYATRVHNIISPASVKYSCMAFDTGTNSLVQWQSIGYIEMSPQATTPQFTGTLLGARLIGKGF